MKLISIIVPCLNEQEVIPIFYRTVTEVLDSLENAEYELLFVDDGSDDRTLKVRRLWRFVPSGEPQRTAQGSGYPRAHHPEL